jgi:hypothetical protein
MFIIIWGQIRFLCRAPMSSAPFHHTMSSDKKTTSRSAASSCKRQKLTIHYKSWANSSKRFIKDCHCPSLHPFDVTVTLSTNFTRSSGVKAEESTRLSCITSANAPALKNWCAIINQYVSDAGYERKRITILTCSTNNLSCGLPSPPTTFFPR